MSEKIKQPRKRKPIPWEAGFICAVATGLRQNGEEGYAKDMLGCINVQSIKWETVDPMDYEILKQHNLVP